jgi:hypothetical protein
VINWYYVLEARGKDLMWVFGQVFAVSRESGHNVIMDLPNYDFK